MNVLYLFRLTRLPVSLAVTFSAFAAAVLFRGTGISWEIFWPMAGIFLLASGASALNQYQEWPYDEKMERTRSRPIPSREITTARALGDATILIIAGYCFLIVSGAWLTLFLGIFNVLWYNGVYTLLKRETAFAVVPGALTGAIPVYMGWTAAGGALNALPPLYLAFFIFLWQMPHFWLIMLKYGDEYKKAGFPSLTDLLKPGPMKRIIFTWILASSFAAALLVYFGIIRDGIIRDILMAVNVLVLLLIFYGLFIVRSVHYRMLFLCGNLLMFLVLLFILADRLLN